ncbi:MAG: DUF3306 domain-containing protein [Methylophilaceae bacterium]|jgi:hypothetical protein
MNTTASFLRRWSRLKLQGGDQPVEEPDVKGAALPLPAPETLDFNADFSLFMRDGVDGETRRNALRKLFMTDHYRAMDGLDVYVDDYSRPTLLPSDLLQTLDHAHALLQKTEESVAEAAVQPIPDHPEQV